MRFLINLLRLMYESEGYGIVERLSHIFEMNTLTIQHANTSRHNCRTHNVSIGFMWQFDFGIINW